MSIVPETYSFGNLTQVDEPKVMVIPTPYEYTTSYGKGTKFGPQAILNASSKLEFFDDELWVDVSKLGINTSPLINCDYVSSKSNKPFLELTNAVRTAHIQGALPVVIGGEQAISFGSIKAVYDLFPEVSILHFDAHPDLKDSYRNNKYSHVSTMKRVVEAMPDLKIVQIGIRNISKEEKDYLETDLDMPSIEIFFGKEKNKWNVTDILSSLTKNVYISFDFSVLDISIMPSTGKPEPDGLLWDQTLDILKNVCAFKEIVGMDFVELSPILGLHTPDFVASKLIQKTIAYTFARYLGALDEKEEIRKREITSGIKLKKIGI